MPVIAPVSWSSRISIVAERAVATRPGRVPKPAAPKTEASRPLRPNNPRLVATAASVAAPAKLPRSSRNAATTKTATAPPLRTAAAADAGLNRANLRMPRSKR